jgi:hypothetical protein
MRTATHVTRRFATCAALILAAVGLGSNVGNASDVVEQSPSPAGAEIYIISPKDGDKVTSPVTILFGLKGMGVAPAGVQKPNTGHHHLLLDGAIPTINTPIPADETHIHFGGGQTQTTLKLTPGEHTLQLLLADYLHIPHSPPVISKSVKVTVKGK